MSSWVWQGSYLTPQHSTAVCCSNNNNQTKFHSSGKLSQSSKYFTFISDNYRFNSPNTAFPLQNNKLPRMHNSMWCSMFTSMWQAALCQITFAALQQTWVWLNLLLEHLSTALNQLYAPRCSTRQGQTQKTQKVKDKQQQMHSPTWTCHPRVCKKKELCLLCALLSVVPFIPCKTHKTADQYVMIGQIGAQKLCNVSGWTCPKLSWSLPGALVCAIYGCLPVTFLHSLCSN